MSQFSNQLQRSIEEEEFTQSELVDQVGVSQGQMSRYVNGANRPDLDVFEKICGLFSESQRTSLLLAYLADDVPNRFRNLIDVSARRSAARAQEDSGAYRRRMPRRLREAFDFLERKALEKQSVADALIASAEVLKGN